MLINSGYIIAIPSYNRAHELSKKTLKLLNNYKVNPEIIYIFVANEEEELIYKTFLNKDNYNKIIVGELGIRNQRKFISKYFPEGQRIVSIDDDVRAIVEFVKKNEYKDIENFNELINYFFSNCISNNSFLWGIYPTPNPFWMSDKIHKNLKFIIGVFHGYINRHDEVLYPDIKSEGKEDLEQSILFYKKDKIILRFDKYCFKSTFNAPGGLGQDRFVMNQNAQDYLVEAYPDICHRKFKKSGIAEIRLTQPK
jgi:hypothetical protein